MYKKFNTAVSWNLFGAISYKIILLAHQIILFKFISKDIYGIIGTIFATLFLMIDLTGFGFDHSVLLRFEKYKKSRNIFFITFVDLKNRFISILISAVLIFGIARTIFIYDLISVPDFISKVPYSILFITAFLFVLENFKRSVENLAQLSFLNKNIAKIQIASLTFYVASVWIWYIISNKITLLSMFLPLLIFSIAETIMLLWEIYRFYKKILPKKSDEKINAIKWLSIKSGQIQNYFNQVNRYLFSANALAIIIAYNFSMSEAGSIKFFVNIATLMYTLLGKAIIAPGGALMSDQLSDANRSFLYFVNSYIQLLYLALFSSILILVCYSSWATLINLGATTQSYLAQALFIIIIGFIESILFAYEKLFVVKNNGALLAKINGIALFILGLTTIYLYLNGLESDFFILIILMNRLLIAFLVFLITAKKWGILPKMTPSKNIVATTIFFFLLLVIIFKS